MSMKSSRIMHTDAMKNRHLSEMLCDAIRKSTHYRHEKKLPQWDKVFAKFRKEQPECVRDLEAVLRWYCGMLKDKRSELPAWLRTCHSAAQFCGLFPYLRAKYKVVAADSLHNLDKKWIELAQSLLSEFNEKRLSIQEFAVFLCEMSEWYVKTVNIIERGTAAQRKKYDALNYCFVDLSGPWGFSRHVGRYILKWGAGAVNWNGSIRKFRLGEDRFRSYMKDRLQELCPSHSANVRSLQLLIELGA